MTDPYAYKERSMYYCLDSSCSAFLGHLPNQYKRYTLVNLVLFLSVKSLVYLLNYVTKRHQSFDKEDFDIFGLAPITKLGSSVYQSF